MTAELATGNIGSRRALATAERCAVALVTSRRQPHLGFLVALTASPLVIGLEADSFRGQLVGLQVQRSGGPEASLAFFRHPQSLCYVSAIPETVSPRGELVSNRMEASGWERFHLREFEAEALTEGARRVLARVAPLFLHHLTVASVLALLEAPNRSDLASDLPALLRLLTFDDLARAVAVLLDRGPLPFGVERQPAASWRQAFDALAAWKEQRPRTKVLEIGRDQDWLHKAYKDWRHDTILEGQANQLARRAIEPRQDLCIIATARNEGIYFIDWIAHYRALGADHVFLYTNDNNDGSDELLAALADAGVITWVRNSIGEATDGQIKAYTHALSILPDTLDYRWALVVDLDEVVVLNPEKHESLPALLRAREQQGAVAVAFTWVMFTPDGRREYDPAPLIERFQRKEPMANRHVKTAFQPRYHLSSWPHDPVAGARAPGTYVNAAGTIHHWPGKRTPPSEGEPNFDDAWLGHYFYKSIDEWIWKGSRNRGGYALRRELSFNVRALEGPARWFDASATEPERGALVHLDSLREEAARLRRLPGVAEAEAAIRRNFQDMVSAMKTTARETLGTTTEIDEPTRQRYLDLLGDTTR